MPVSEKTFLQLALEEPNQWELHCGELRRKPSLTASDNELAFELAFQIRQPSGVSAPLAWGSQRQPDKRVSWLTHLVSGQGQLSVDHPHHVARELHGRLREHHHAVAEVEVHFGGDRTDL